MLKNRSFLLIISSLLLLFSFSIESSAQVKRGTLVFEDSFGVIAGYSADEQFLRELTNWARNSVPSDYQVWISDIIKALRAGANVRFNPSENTIAGMQGKWHISDEKILSTGRSSFRRSWDATLGNQAHQFRVAVSYLGYFLDYKQATY